MFYKRLQNLKNSKVTKMVVKTKKFKKNMNTLFSRGLYTKNISVTLLNNNVKISHAFHPKNFWTEIIESIKIFLDSIFISNNKNTESTNTLIEQQLEVNQTKDLPNQETKNLIDLKEKDFEIFMENLIIRKPLSTNKSLMPVEDTVIGSSNCLKEYDYNTASLSVVKVSVGENVSEVLSTLNLNKVVETKDIFELPNLSMMQSNRVLRDKPFGQIHLLHVFQKLKNYKI